MSDLQRDLDRAARAERLMSDELLVEAFDKLETEYIEFWKGSRVMGSDEREKIWNAVQVLHKVKGHLATVLQNGAIAAAELNQLTK